MKILMIDDDPDIGPSVRKMLKPEGHTLDICLTAREALDIMEKKSYDFILVDKKMPTNDGIWFMKHAKIPEGTKALLVTAYVDRKAIDEMLRLGAVGYLLKPFDKTELARTIRFYSAES